MSDILLSLYHGLYKALRSLALHTVSPQKLQPREFSNALVKRYGPFFKGAAVNVSGWDDRDGEGGFYRDYFPGKTSYTVTNAPTEAKGFGSLSGSHVREVALDLTIPLAPGLVAGFDIVFNHTTLEHIFEIEAAFANLCRMSRDAVVLVVPVIQQVHIVESFGDYWRPTTIAIAKLFRKNGFEPLVVKTNDQPFAPVYCVAIAVRDPKKYEELFKVSLDFEMGASLFGSSLKKGSPDKLAR